MHGSVAARASPIETAVAAIKMETASVRIAISWSSASGRGACADASAAGNLNIINLPRINIDICRTRLPPMLARVGPDCGEAVDE
jgi:hypothetical protein